jgi:hypothetical protein
MAATASHADGEPAAPHHETETILIVNYVPDAYSAVDFARLFEP